MNNIIADGLWYCNLLRCSQCYYFGQYYNRKRSRDQVLLLMSSGKINSLLRQRHPIAPLMAMIISQFHEFYKKTAGFRVF